MNLMFGSVMLDKDICFHIQGNIRPMFGLDDLYRGKLISTPRIIFVVIRRVYKFSSHDFPFLIVGGS